MHIYIVFKNRAPHVNVQQQSPETQAGFNTHTWGQNYPSKEM